MPIQIDPKKPFPTLVSCMRPSTADLWDANTLLWAQAEGPLAPKISDEEYLAASRAYHPDRRSIDESWARFIDDDPEIQKAISCPPSFMRDNLTREIRYTQIERAALDIAHGTLGAIHTLRACCYGWNGIVQAKVVSLLGTNEGHPDRQLLRTLWADVSRQEGFASDRNADLRDRLQRQHESLLTSLKDKTQSEQDAHDINALLEFARSPNPQLPAKPQAPHRRPASGKAPATP